MSRFPTVTDKVNFPEEEEKVLQQWTKNDVFKTSIKLSEGRKEYLFYDGPPFATGLPHYGHILAGTIKDCVTRYAHQTGHYVSRRAGWDCHGLPVEYEIDKKLKITGRQMVIDMGVDVYNNECRSIVQRYTKEWEKTVTRLGRWIDFENDYKTMDPQFMESVWWVFKTLFDKGLIYRGYKVMPYSTFCGTVLSNFEASSNYKDVADPAAVVSFPIIDQPDVNLIAWTTTPWTLPSNLALCVNPAFEYVKIKDKTRNKIFVLLEARIGQILPEVNKKDCTDERKAELYEILDRIPGEKLIGIKYVPLFNCFKETQKNAFRVVGDSYVTADGGTGIVHQAPAFGEDDYRVCIAQKIISVEEDGLPCPVDVNGKFTAEVSEFQGRNVKEADNDILKVVKAADRLVQKDSYVHSYPFCWRSETPLIYKAVPSYFVSVEKIKDRLEANNKKTRWVPSYVGEKRFANWISDAKDWAISRNRFWGTPLPLWVSDDLEEVVAVGSIEELYQLSGVRVTDLHKEFVDKITIPSKQGKGVLRRVDEVFDCWFESGSMPYAQLHYPFDNKERFQDGFPADFIAEGLDQTRGWFYTLMVLGTGLFDKPAFHNVIVNGLVLAADGKKMSKRLKNYPDPTLVIDKHGSDSLRLYLINSPVVRADVLRFQEAGVVEVVRGVLLPWYNAFRFFVQCVDRWEADNNATFTPDTSKARSSTNDVDVWILAASLGLVKFVHEEMSNYRLYTVVPRLLDFIDQLTKWYVRLNRTRLKGEAGDEAALQGLNVLYEVLVTMTLIMCPFTPFFTEYLYQHLRQLHPAYGNTDPSIPADAFGKAESVHYLMVPTPDEKLMNPRAVERFHVLQECVNLVRIGRERRKIRNNLPLKKVIVVAANAADLEALQYLKDYFVSEINAIDVEFTTEYDKMCSLKVIPNWKEVGKRLGKQMKEVAKAVNELTTGAITKFIETGSLEVCGFTLSQAEVVVKREFNGDTKNFEASASEDGSIMVALDTTCDDELMDHLRSRTVIGAINKLRKSAGLEVQDSVEMFYAVEGGKHDVDVMKKIGASLHNHQDFVMKRLRSMPLPAPRFMPQSTLVIGKEKLKDQDICATGHFVLLLTRPCVSVSNERVLASLNSSNTAQLSTISRESSAQTAAMLLETMDYSRVCDQESVSIEVDGIPIVLKRGEHYFANAQERAKAMGIL